MNDKKNSPAVSPVLIAALLILVLACAATLLYRLHASNNSVAVAMPTESPMQTPATSTPLNVPGLGIQLNLLSSISDAYFSFDSGSSLPVAAFSTHSLVADGGSGCEPGLSNGGPIGTIEVTKSLQSPNVGEGESGYYGQLIKQLGNEYLYYQSVQSTCSASSSAEELQTKQIAAFKDSLQTAELSKQ